MSVTVHSVDTSTTSSPAYVDEAAIPQEGVDTTTPRRATASAKLVELESLRGLAALLVVFYHIPKWNPMLNAGVVNNAYLMVELFFVLSGFVIFNAYAEKICVRKDLLRFQLLRFGRLYPVHLLFLLAFLAIETTKYFAEARLGISVHNSRPFEENDFGAFAKNIFLVQAVLPDQPVTFNYPAWSISVEFYTYLAFGLVVLFLGEAKHMLFALIATASLVMLGMGWTFGSENLLRCLAGFFVGCLTAQAIRNTKLKLPGYVSLIVMALIVIFLQLKPAKHFDMVVYFLTSALVASLILAPQGLLNRILSFRALVWLGAISYSVYMSHATVVWVVKQIIRVVLKRPEVIARDGQSIPQLSNMDALLANLAIVASVLLVSAAVYHFIEMPMRERSRRLVFGRLN